MLDSLAGTSILVADDESSIRYLLQDILEPDGAYVHLASSGEEALTIIHQNRLDLAILDIHMPDPGGLDILQQLRDAGNLLPVLIITAQDIPDHQPLIARQVNGSAYLPKPFEPDTMLDTIYRHLQQQT
jgi:CheY-like chemotaxis protein